MSDSQNFKENTPPMSMSLNEVNIISYFINQNEDATINENNQNEVDSNNVTLTNASMTEINNISSQESFQNVRVFNNEKFKNVTIRANETLHENLSLKIANNESFEKKRGFSLNLEFQNQVNGGLKQSIENDENQGESEQEDYTNKFSNLYLQDKYYELNEDFSMSTTVASNISNDLNNCELQIPPKINQFYFDELESEKALNSLKNNDSPNSIYNATSNSSSNSVSSSSISFRSDSSYSNEENCFGSTFQGAQKQPKERKVPILNQNAPCFKPLLSQNLNLTNTSTPTNKVNAKFNQATAQNYSQYEKVEDHQSQINQIDSENSKFLSRPSLTNSKFSNENYIRNQNCNYLKGQNDGKVTTSNNRVPKSLTTHFSEYRRDGTFNQNFPITFGHSTSYDNIGALSCEFSQSNRFKNVTYRYSDNYNKSDSDSININNFSFQTSNNLSNRNETRQNGEPIVLHVRNLDYKISLDEWQRILLENFRKHCREVVY